MKNAITLLALTCGLLFAPHFSHGFEIDLKDYVPEADQLPDEEGDELKEIFEDIENVPTACRGRIIPSFLQWRARSCEPKVVCTGEPPKMCPKQVCWTGTTWETKQFTRPYTVEHSSHYYETKTHVEKGSTTLTTFTPHTSTHYETVNTPGCYVRTACGCEYRGGGSYTRAVDVTSYSARTQQIPYSYTVTTMIPRERHWTTTEYETYCKKVAVQKEYCKTVMVPCS